MALHQESHELNSLLDSGQSPRHLERSSLSRLSPLPGHLITVSFWYAGSLRSLVKSGSSYLKAVSYIPASSPTLRWTCDILVSLTDANQVFDLAAKVGVLNKLLPIGVSFRSTLVAKLLLTGFIYKSPGVTRVMRRMKPDKIEQDVASSPDINSLIGMRKPLVRLRKWEGDIKETIAFIAIY